jgi:hypothetical protein
MLTLDQQLNLLAEIDARDDAIETLAEQLTVAATMATREVMRASNYEVSSCDILTETNHNESFNEVFYAIAEKFIDSK